MAYCPKYDCYYNSDGEWEETKCGDDDCEYCKDRPEKAGACNQCGCSGKDD